MGNTVLKHFLHSDIGEIRIFSRDEKKQDDMRHDLQPSVHTSRWLFLLYRALYCKIVPMKLIYIFIKQFRNIYNQEVTFSDRFSVSYNPELSFPDSLKILPKNENSLNDFVYSESNLKNVHVIVGKTGAGKTNILQLIGMEEEERLHHGESGDSFFLLYEDKKKFLIEPFNIPVTSDLIPKNIREPVFAGRKIPEDSVKRKASLVIENSNWRDKIRQHIDGQLEAHDYWTFSSRLRQDEMTAFLGKKAEKHKAVSVKQQFINDLLTDYALYLRKWISYIEMFPAEISLNWLKEKLNEGKEAANLRDRAFFSKKQVSCPCNVFL